MLARIGRLDLLGTDLALVDRVIGECTVKSDEAARAIRQLAEQRGVVTVLRAADFPARLGPGESTVLSLAQERQDVVCVLDDRAARTAARALGIRVTGTLGLLMKSKTDGTIEALGPWLEQALLCGLYLDKATVSRALRAVGE